jgi:cation diffusion facilitator family transporter
MKEAHSRDDTALCEASQLVDRSLDFRQLGHRSSTMALTAFTRRTQTAPMRTPTQSGGVTTTPAGSRPAGVRRALMVVLCLNAASAALKIAVGARTGALTVLGAALESTLDMLSNGVAIAAISIAAREPDEDHPYGHEKFETLGTLAIVCFLSITCFELVRRSVAELAGEPAAPVSRSLDAVLLLLSLGVNVFVVRYEHARGRQYRSALLMADASHAASDIFVTALAIASLVLSTLGFLRADAILGIVVALIIAWSGYQILRGSIPVLVDARGMDAAELARIARTVPGVEAVRSVRSRRTSSGHLFVELTILVMGSTSVKNAHDLTDEVEAAISRELGGADAVVHVEPA